MKEILIKWQQIIYHSDLKISELLNTNTKNSFPLHIILVVDQLAITDIQCIDWGILSIGFKTRFLQSPCWEFFS